MQYFPAPGDGSPAVADFLYPQQDETTCLMAQLPC